jgi:hypothetical protein
MTVDFRIGDMVRLRKAHPCGGFVWRVVRLGADIGLTCETCGRRVLLPRATVERRMKAFVERGPAIENTPASATEAEADKPLVDFTCDLLGVKGDDILEVLTDLEVPVVVYYSTGTDTASGLLGAGARVRVTTTPPPGSTTILLEPLDYETFEQRYVPGGMRKHELYNGYALEVPCAVLARHFRPVPNDHAD